MARKSKRSSKNTSSILPAWIWLTLGILIGLGIAMFTRINERYTEDVQITSEKQQNEVCAKEVNTKRKFDFYTLLPELEIVIPEEETQLPKNKTIINKENTTYQGGYLLQAGSFQKLNEADSLKAKLALLGVEANIQSVNVNNTTWHRVRIGPSNDRQALEQLRKRLHENRIDTMLLQAKQ